ncbi:tetratricopeptide repeat protein [Sphingorhabdus sp.]|uniref:tetratricopeptide repeat protein n=1 Tax=Sphingorhabdus sp. TaxID=1902408 RepID=UPI0032B702E1
MKNHRLEIAYSVAAFAMLGGCSAFQPQARLEIRSVETAHRSSDATDPVAEGRGLLALGQNANAISAFRSALREDPNSGDAYNGLAIAYDRIGRQDLAQRYFELAVSASPDDMRYRGNLARLFERTGQPKLALGLVDAASPRNDTAQMPEHIIPVAVTPTQSPQFVSAIAAVEPSVHVIAAPINLPTLADLEIEGAIAEQHGTKTDKTDTTVRLAGLTSKPAIIPAVYRPNAALTINSAAIETRNLPKPGPQRSPHLPSERQPADLPRQAVMPVQREGIRLERVSLGEVRLVTRLSTPKLANETTNFASFGVRLATWLPGAIAVERQGHEVRLAESPNLKGAIARAQIETAIDDVTQEVEEIAKLQTFTYAFFHDEGVEEVTLATL